MGDSLRPYIKTTSLFIRDVDRSVTREQFKGFLEKLCPPSKGTVVIPTNSSNNVLGTAYLNFWSEDEGGHAMLACCSCPIGGAGGAILLKLHAPADARAFFRST